MTDFTSIMRLQDDEFKRFAKLIHEESGIFMKDTKITLLSNRLRKRLKALNIETFSEYYNYITGLKDKSEEIESLIDVVSTNETYFFRNEKQFDAFADFCLPAISKRKSENGEKKLRIWSAGCSTGEEPYTIAICIMEKLHLFPGWEISITATDIAPSVLDFARKAEYLGRRIEKVKSDFLKKYFIQNSENPEIFKVKDEVKKYIRFDILNLFKGQFPKSQDIVFCRNVMIYFDKEHQKRLISGFYGSVCKYGFLFLGHSETLHSISEDFIYRKIKDTPVYIPREMNGEL
jgi:chemotaxis protein methyltransferase CheR